MCVGKGRDMQSMRDSVCESTSVIREPRLGKPLPYVLKDGCTRV